MFRFVDFPGRHIKRSLLFRIEIIMKDNEFIVKIERVLGSDQFIPNSKIFKS